MEHLQLSIIIPVYNTEKYLKKCLDSILASNLERTELILVDDGSADGSREICRQYAQTYSFIRLICQQGAGPSSARNRGLEAASGEYVIFFDSDDYISPAALHKTLALLDRCPEAECWISDFYRAAENGCILDRVFQISDTKAPILEDAYLCRFLKEPDCIWNVWRYIFRRDFLLCHGLRFRESIHCAEDLEFVVHVLSLSPKMAFFHNPYYFYRVNYGQTLTRVYTIGRVRHLMEMLQLSARHLNNRQIPAAQLLFNKLALEYLLNLSLLWEIPAGERKKAGQLMDGARWVMSLSDDWRMKMAGAALSLFHIRPVSWLFYRLKRMKRRIREWKIAVYENRWGRNT